MTYNEKKKKRVQLMERISMCNEKLNRFYAEGGLKKAYKHDMYKLIQNFTCDNTTTSRVTKEIGECDAVLMANKGKKKTVEKDIELLELEIKALGE